MYYIGVLYDWLKNNKKPIEEIKLSKEIENKYSYNNVHSIGSGIKIGYLPTNAEQDILNKYRNMCQFKRKEYISYDPNFMKDFIEANYNIFNLQQKQIDELKDRVEKLEKIEKITLF